MRPLSMFLLALLTIGCDTLFPELGGMKPVVDASVADSAIATGAPHITGAVCVVGDIRDYRSCAIGRPGTWHISSEETRDVIDTDSMGNFTLPLAQKLDHVTLSVSDKTGQFATSIVTVRLTDGIAAGYAVPSLPAQVMQSLADEHGFLLDPTRGALFGYAIDPTGASVANVQTTPVAGATGPYYDSMAPGDFDLAGATRKLGLVALFDVPPPSAQLTLYPGAAATVSGNEFLLPVRPGGITFTVLLLPLKAAQ